MSTKPGADPYARNAIYNLIHAFAATEPGKENTTVTTSPGDLCYFTFDANDLQKPRTATRSRRGQVR